LPGQKRRYLDELANGARGRRLKGLVDIGRNRQAGRLADFGQNSQPVFETRTTVSVQARAIGLVEGRLEYQLNGEPRGDLPNPPRDVERLLFTLDDARPGNHQQSLASPHLIGADGGGIVAG
jgi:hypothetical protein